jgi:hypothetical protein
MRADLLLREIQEIKRSKQDYVSEGHCKDYAEYRQTCGEIKSLVIIEDIIEDIQRREEAADE